MRSLLCSFFIIWMLFSSFCGTMYGQASKHWLGVHADSRGFAFSYSIPTLPNHRAFIIAQMGIISNEVRPERVFPRLAGKYRIPLLALHQASASKKYLCLTPWIGISRPQTIRIRPSFGYWSSDYGLQLSIVQSIMGNEQFEFEWMVGVGYRFLHLNAPDWFEDSERRFAAFYEIWQPPHEGLYPRLGVSVHFGKN